MIRRRYRIRGVVQGVGFRPHVATTARLFPITGFCGNDDHGVFIEAQGQASDISAFMIRLRDTLPPLARIISIEHRELPLYDSDTDFRIVESVSLAGERTLIPPDVATCPDCLADMSDPTNRRYHYPFTTCTNCGPRLSIIEDLPYDRPATTMRIFDMCDACHAEYTNPTDRRYHAQPISCPDCGPHLWLEELDDDRRVAAPPTNTKGRSPAHVAEVLRAAQQLFDSGAILAVKGLGGFHLLCDASNEDAVAKLRQRKRRPAKPFAVMVPDLATATALCELSQAERELLESPAHPIVIAPMRANGTPGSVAEPADNEIGTTIAASVAPGLADIGVMLPYTPLHTLLVDRPLVATSGNLTSEPLCFTNDQARTRLAHIADAFVLHDRPIHVPVEDSVFIGEHPSRRSRGYAPLPMVLPTQRNSVPTILATGGELKNTFTVVHEDLAYVSAHVGDMESLASHDAFLAAVEQMLQMRRVTPDLIVCDSHPNYSTTALADRLADRFDATLLQVQHHYAHALSLIAEHSLHDDTAVIATLDGTGYGTDGSIWGGEILTVRPSGQWERSWHIPEFDIVGGDRAVRHPWRLAAGIAHAWQLPEVESTMMAALRSHVSGDMNASFSAETALVTSQLNNGVGWVKSSSCGRVFDAAAALILASEQTTSSVAFATSYEAQAAMELERYASSYLRVTGSERTRRSSARTLTELFVELCEQRPLAERAFLFHDGLARIIADQLVNIAQRSDTQVVGLTGGCALNRVFTPLIRERVSAAGYRLLEHRSVPANDGGLSLGQALAGRLSVGRASRAADD
ncbi:carbamoyltransferase HypF [Corynebacterium sp. H113]|uniref:carbamoyltransferase HypF n=1 Tax=Corynebacterium sp. H113 TaxID=3133419 RepID=UPI0030A9487F